MNNYFNNLYIFEMANNHQGSVEHGIRIISTLADISRKHHIKAAIKLQYRDLDTLLHPNSIANNDKQTKRFLDTRLSAEQFSLLVAEIKRQGLLAMCTPFDENSVELCEKHEIDVLKVASCSCLDWPLLEQIAQTKKPVIISTGGIQTNDIDRIYNFSMHRELEFALMHCVSLYPAPPEALQLSYIDKMRRRYRDIPIGYSGHEDPDNTLVAGLALAKGASIFERHVGIALPEQPLNSYSSNPDQIEHWICAIQESGAICANEMKDKMVSDSERKALLPLMRGTYAAHDLTANSVLLTKNIYFSIPCLEGQTTSGEFRDGICVKNSYSKDQAIEETVEMDSAYKMRLCIHQIKSALNEAHIVIGKEFNLELSHHYGMDSFKQYGAAIISVINRDYCKKIIILLPGQYHPIHYHKKKEEAFQILSGEMDLELEDQRLHLKPGQVVLVKQNQKHAFSSQDGCIFEEVSTTHFQNDSYYDDLRIAQLDPIIRKTTLTEW